VTVGARRMEPEPAATLRLSLDIQRMSTADGQPNDAQLRRWARAALADLGGSHALTLRLVDAAEGAALNEAYRRASGPTNVLSFPFETPPGMRTRLLGDVVICTPVVEREAHEQGKAPPAHWAHMVVHGVLHLRGYDHLTDVDASAMEALETEILGRLGYPDPYQELQEARGKRQV